MRVSTATAFVIVSVLAPSLLARQTWIVAEDGSGDFTEIQPAVDAASDGDLILVKDGTYEHVWVTKPLSIVGSGIERTVVRWGFDWPHIPMYVQYDQSGDCLIASLTTDSGGDTGLRVWTPAGRFIGWQLEFDPKGAGVEYRQCSLYEIETAWLNNCSVDPSGSGSVVEAPPSLSLGTIDPAFVSQCYFQAFPVWVYDTLDGGPGIAIGGDITRAYIAETDALGSQGGYGKEVDCITFWAAGDGGHGVEVLDTAEVHVFGRTSTIIQGGDGGIGEYPDPYCDQDPAGGDGGDGIHAESGSYVTYSGLFPRGGPGGPGDPPGAPGLPVRGPVVDVGPLPTSTMEGEGRPGSIATFNFHGQPGDQLRIVYSTYPDVFDLPNFEGHPLIPSPEGAFGVVPAGAIPPSGTASFSFTIPSDVPPGQPFYVQGILLGSHAPQLTNMSMLVTTPVWP
ncbi:MAG: hypothetical protein AB1486_00720 [Planctomycetota bacterium]